VCLGKRISLLVEVNLCDLEIEFGRVRTDEERGEEESAIIFPIKIAWDSTWGKEEERRKREEESEERNEARERGTGEMRRGDRRWGEGVGRGE
jgi:hypothetical protein